MSAGVKNVLNLADLKILGTKEDRAISSMMRIVFDIREKERKQYEDFLKQLQPVKQLQTVKQLRPLIEFHSKEKHNKIQVCQKNLNIYTTFFDFIKKHFGEYNS